jgi:Sec-independent protein secretion pathway component TatC
VIDLTINWKELRKCLAIGSLVIGGIATGMPDIVSKIAFAIALGLSNAAIYIKTEENPA